MQFVVHFRRDNGAFVEGQVFQVAQPAHAAALAKGPAFYHAPGYVDVTIEAVDRRAALCEASRALNAELVRRVEHSTIRDTIPAPPPGLNPQNAREALAQVIASVEEMRTGLESLLADARDAGLPAFAEQLELAATAALEQALALRLIADHVPVVAIEIETTADGAERLRAAYARGELRELAGFPVLDVRPTVRA